MDYQPCVTTTVGTLQKRKTGGRNMRMHWGVLSTMVALALAIAAQNARATLVTYDFSFFDSVGTNVGGGALVIAQTVIDDALAPANGLLNTEVEPGDRFIHVKNWDSFSVTVFGHVFTRDGHQEGTTGDSTPAVPTSGEGALIDAAGDFAQLIDAQLAGGADSTDIIFSLSLVPSGAALLIFHEEIPGLFAIESPVADGSDVCVVLQDECFFTVSTSTSAVPEPATLALLGIGITGLGWMRRRPRQQHSCD